MYLLLNLSHCVKSYGHFANFYDARSTNTIMSRDPRYNFENFLLCPNSTFNIRKSHSGKALYFKSYQHKNIRGVGWKTPPPQCL